MLDVAQARQQLLASVQPLAATEIVELNACINRVLASDAVALVNAPPFRRSVMDGYAVRRDLGAGIYPLAFESAAGSPPTVLPDGRSHEFSPARRCRGADAVVPQEMCQAQADGIQIQLDVDDWIRPVGDDIADGSVVARRGQRITPTLIGTLITAGLSQVEVFVPPKIAIVATGNELNPAGSVLPPGGIYNSVQPVLAAWFTQLGYEVVATPHAPDTLADTQAVLADVAGRADLVLTLGGVSVGDHDHVRPAIESLGTSTPFDC